MKKRYILLGSFAVTLAIAYAASAPYLKMLQEYQQLQKIVNDTNPLTELPERILDVNPELVEFPEPRSVSAYQSNPNSDRNAYFGDLHVHTGLSFDAYAFGTTASPADAYRFARGDAIKHPSGFDMQLKRPLDFYGVTDHAMFLGVVGEAADTSSAFSKNEIAAYVHNINADGNDHWTRQSKRYLAFARFLPEMISGISNGTLDRGEVAQITQDAWRDTIIAADMHYEPGTFTTFVGYEYTTSSNDFGNLHRNVIFRSSAKLPSEPFSRFHSQNPEGLWDWMDGLRENGIESLAIPHNSNGSNGQMFKLVDWAGDPLDDDYSNQRARNEPLVEITQVKGTSDTHPLLSKNDEWADFEIMQFRVATFLQSEPSGSYVRDAYLKGLALEDAGLENPYKFGLIGSSDTHVAAPSLYEEDYHAKVGVMDSDPSDRGSVPITGIRRGIANQFMPSFLKDVDGNQYFAARGDELWGASGLAGVWAEENTREAIYDAFRRKETFATTGPRIKVRFFAGHGLQEELLQSTDMVSSLYATGTPMGGDLELNGSSRPQFVVWGVRDSLGAPLQRLQIIKGYVRGGEHHEVVYDVACSDGLDPDSATHRCPDNQAKVDLSDCSISEDVGANELLTLWQDPDFDATLDAFYYVRVLENPTCRWSTWDALQAGVEPRSDLPATIQERAWSSPIWVRSEQ